MVEFKEMPYGEKFTQGEVVLVHYQNQPAFFARIERLIPDRKKGTIELAHLLLPRFLSQKESDFTDLKIVLNKMYLNSQNSQFA